MHSKDLSDVIFLLGSFQVKKKKKSTWETKDWSFSLKEMTFLKKDAQNTNSEYEIDRKCTVFNNIHSH